MVTCRIAEIPLESTLPAADLADIVEELGPEAREAVIRSIDVVQGEQVRQGQRLATLADDEEKILNVYNWSDYIAADTVAKFGTTALVYTIPFVVYGIFRYLYLVYIRNAGGNPEEVLLRDSPFLLNALLWMGAAIAVLYFFRA